MNKTRLEAFSDGVLAIAITIMVLEIKAPHGADPSQLQPMIPDFLSYVLSFIYLGIYWNNHHHLLQASRQVNGRILWANLHLLFWLSLIPFVTRWMGENNFAPWPVLFYGVVLFFSGLAYYILERTLIAAHDLDSPLAQALGRDPKAILSIAAYALAIAGAAWIPLFSCALYALVALMWLIPDRRIERRVAR
jgi:Predicted integral membrane protein